MNMVFELTLKWAYVRMLSKLTRPEQGLFQLKQKHNLSLSMLTGYIIIVLGCKKKKENKGNTWCKTERL